jgi:hypothetical protein
LICIGLGTRGPKSGSKVRNIPIGSWVFIHNQYRLWQIYIIINTLGNYLMRYSFKL